MTLAEINWAIRAAKRMGVRPPKMLLRYKAVLEGENRWKRKKKIAETWLKKYQRRSRYYERQIYRKEVKQ